MIFLAHGGTLHVDMSGFLRAWDFDPLIIIPLLLSVTFYAIGWARLRLGGHHQLATRWRLTSYMAGQVVLAISLLSGVDIYQSSLFFMHMIQHLLIMMIAPPLLWWGSPLPIVLWGMPRDLRFLAGSLLGKRALFRRFLETVATPGKSVLIYVSTIWLWHDPSAYNGALRNNTIHYAEHLCFFLGAMLFSWHITGARPRLFGRLSYARRMGLVVLALIANQILAVGITLSESVIYDYYLTVPRINDITAYNDQVLGGVIMWVPGGMMYVLTLVFLFSRLIVDGKPPLRVKTAPPQLAPGVEGSGA